LSSQQLSLISTNNIRTSVRANIERSFDNMPIGNRTERMRRLREELAKLESEPDDGPNTDNSSPDSLVVEPSDVDNPADLPLEELIAQNQQRREKLERARHAQELEDQRREKLSKVKPAVQRVLESLGIGFSDMKKITGAIGWESFSVDADTGAVCLQVHGEAVPVSIALPELEIVRAVRSSGSAGIVDQPTHSRIAALQEEKATLLRDKHIGGNNQAAVNRVGVINAELRKLEQQLAANAPAPKVVNHPVDVRLIQRRQLLQRQMADVRAKYAASPGREHVIVEMDKLAKELRQVEESIARQRNGSAA
jgi:hypothetical protein